MPGIDTGWRVHHYGTDLISCIGDWSNPVVWGNGRAYLQSRRREGVLYGQLTAVIGTTTAIPVPPADPAFGPGWFWELPGDFAPGGAPGGPVPSLMFGMALAVHRSGALVGGEFGTSFGLLRTRTGSIVPGDIRPGIDLFFPGWDGGTGQLTKAFPFNWNVDDSLECTISSACLDN